METLDELCIKKIFLEIIYLIGLKNTKIYDKLKICLIKYSNNLNNNTGIINLNSAYRPFF